VRLILSSVLKCGLILLSLSLIVDVDVDVVAIAIAIAIAIVIAVAFVIVQIATYEIVFEIKFILIYSTVSLICVICLHY
jgi:hypothetical protein